MYKLNNTCYKMNSYPISKIYNNNIHCASHGHALTLIHPIRIRMRKAAMRPQIPTHPVIHHSFIPALSGSTIEIPKYHSRS